MWTSRSKRSTSERLPSGRLSLTALRSSDRRSPEGLAGGRGPRSGVRGERRPRSPSARTGHGSPLVLTRPGGRGFEARWAKPRRPADANVRRLRLVSIPGDGRFIQMTFVSVEYLEARALELRPSVAFDGGPARPSDRATQSRRTSYCCHNIPDDMSVHVLGEPVDDRESANRGPTELVRAIRERSLLLRWSSDRIGRFERVHGSGLRSASDG